MNSQSLRIGFVSTRLEGIDGVSLEAFKWADILEELGHECFFFAGACDRQPERSCIVPEAHFNHEAVQRTNHDLFDDDHRSAETTRTIHSLWMTLQDALRDFVEAFDVNLLVVENALSLPMNVALGMAITSYIAETNIPTIAHHHDFSWERPRYNVHAAADFIQASFPPVMPQIYNVVINSYAATQLARRTGMRCMIIPNVMDFDTPPSPPDDLSMALRTELGVSADDSLLLQPTRVVPRKRIERSIELAARLDVPNTLMISHGSGDEGREYARYLRDFARRMHVRVLFASEHFSHSRQRAIDGRQLFSLADAYQAADLVTYPSIAEGFGNAFLEAIYYRRPLAMRSYEIFATDIKPKGFSVIEFGEFTTDKVVEQVRGVLKNPDRAAEVSDRNYELGKRHFSYESLRRQLSTLTDHLLESLPAKDS